MLDDATVEMMKKLTATPDIKENGAVIDIDDPVINLLLEALANRAQYLNEVGLEYLISRLKQLYVERLPDKGLSTNDFTDELLQKLLETASKGDLQTVKNELVEIINTITSFEYQVVSELPSKGKKGVIYLLRLDKFNTVKNLYEEYIWVQDRYELLGMFDTGQDGPFVTTDNLKNTLKEYVKKIKIGDATIGPDLNNIADISDAITAFVGGSFQEVNNNLQNVRNELLDMINAITSFEYQVVSELPSKGKKGVIYLLRLDKFNTVKNLYEEYIWVQDRYELLGMFDTGQDGPFVTTDNLKNTLKEYVKKIKIGDSIVGPDVNNIADISEAITAFVGGSFQEVNNNLQNVRNELLDMIGGITSFEYKVVSELPSKGEKGVVYLLRLTEFTTVKNLYEEYIWVQDRYELLGTFDAAQSGPFVTDSNFQKEIDKIWNDIERIVSFDVVIVSSLPTTGKIGRLYLVVNPSGTDGNKYNEYLWVNNKYELVGGSSGDFITEADLSSTLSHYVKRIIIGDQPHILTSNGIVNITTALNAHILDEFGPFLYRVVLNGTSYFMDDTGTVNLGTISGGSSSNANTVAWVRVNGTYYEGTSTGDMSMTTSKPSGFGFNVGYYVDSVTINGSTYYVNEKGNINLGTIGSGGSNIDTSDFVKSIMMNNAGATKPNANGLVTFRYVVFKIQMNGNTIYVPDQSGICELGNIVKSITINGTTKTPDASGLVDLGTISGGSSSGNTNTVHTGTSEPASSLGSNNDFYYKFPS